MWIGSCPKCRTPYRTTPPKQGRRLVLDCGRLGCDGRVPFKPLDGGPTKRNKTNPHPGLAIRISTLPQTHRNARSIRMIVRDYNLKCDNHKGKGNRFRRRAGLPVIDPHTLGPFGSIGMNRAQIAKMMRTPPDK